MTWGIAGFSAVVVGMLLYFYFRYWRKDGDGGDPDDPTSRMLTLADLAKIPFYLYEWQSYEYAKIYDDMAAKCWRFARTGEGVEEFKAVLKKWFADDIWMAEGSGRFLVFVLVAYEIAVKKHLLGNAEIDKFMAGARKAAEACEGKYAKDAKKQMHAGPLYAWLGQKARFDQFINSGYTPINLEPGSSHYSVIGNFNLIIGSHWRGVLQERQLQDCATYWIERSAITRYSYGREYYNLYRGQTFYINLMLLLMWLVHDRILQGMIKWVVNRHINYLHGRNLPLNVFAPLFVLAEWDAVQAVEPVHGSDIPGERASRIKGAPQEVYLRINWGQTFNQQQLAVVRSGWNKRSIACFLNLAPFNSKGDRGYAGEIAALEANGAPLVNGTCTYFTTSAEGRSVRGGDEYNAKIKWQIENDDVVDYCFSCGGWSRRLLLYKKTNILEVIDEGKSPTYWHFVKHDDFALFDPHSMVLNGMMIEFEAPMVEVAERFVGDTGSGARLYGEPAKPYVPDEDDESLKLDKRYKDAAATGSVVAGVPHEKGGFISDNEVFVKVHGEKVVTRFSFRG